MNEPLWVKTRKRRTLELRLGLALRLFQHPPPHQPCGTTFPHTANLAAGHKVGSHPQGHQNGTGKTDEGFHAAQLVCELEGQTT